MDGQIPPPPDGYTLQDTASSIPPPPPGYSIQPAQPSNQLPTATVTPTAQDFRDAGQSVPGKYRTGDETTFQKINDFGNDLGDAFAHNLGNLPVSLAQTAAHGIQSLTNAGASTAAPGSIGARAAGFVNNQVGNLDNAIQQREQNYQSAVPTNTASVIGAGIGQVLPYAVGGEVAAIPKAATTLGKVGMGVLGGGAVGALQPVTTGASPGSPDFAAEKAKQIGVGAVLGGAIPAVASGLRGVNSLAQHIYAPQTIAQNNLARTLGATPENINKLGNYVNPVAGETPTTAQVLANPRAVMVEKAMANNPVMKEQLVTQQNNNNASRLSVLQKLAGDENTLQTALDTRRAATQPFIDANLSPNTPAIRYTNAQQPIADALSKPMVRDADFHALNDANGVLQKVKSGAMQEDDALEELGHIAATTKQGGKAQQAIRDAVGSINQGMIDPSSVLKAVVTTKNATSLGQNPTVNKALTQIESQIKAAQNINGLVPANMLDGIRQNASRILQANSDVKSIVGNQEQAGIAPVKQQITDLLSKNVPGYKDYLAAYATHSRPINDMQAARGILEASTNGVRNSVDSPVLTLNHVNKGLNASDNATYGLSPAARQQVEGLQSSLQRDSISNSIKSPGSDTNYNAQAQGWLAKQLLGGDLSGTSKLGRGAAAVIGGLLGEHFGGPAAGAAGFGAGAFINKAANLVNDRIMAAYAKGLLDPQAAKTMLTNYLQANKKQAPALLRKFPAWQALIGESQSANNIGNLGGTRPPAGNISNQLQANP